MYTPPKFRVSEHARLHALMRDYPFAALLNPHGDGTEITHLPFLLDSARGERGVLLGHMARANPHWRHFDGKREAIVIFTGPHAYISPSWYTDPHTVPTWNYAVVHARGRPCVIEEKTRARSVLERLVKEHEASLDPPWSMARAEPGVDGQLDHIVAFEIEISGLEGKFKLSQNRPRADRQGVVDALAGSSDQLQRSVAGAMQATLPGNEDKT